MPLGSGATLPTIPRYQTSYVYISNYPYYLVNHGGKGEEDRSSLSLLSSKLYKQGLSLG